MSDRAVSARRPAIRFDHIEVHVADIPRYAAFLTGMFDGGTTEILNAEGVSMFTSPEGLNIEIKPREVAAAPALSGFCNPCLRMVGARSFVEQTLGYAIIEERRTPQGYPVHFFKDYEGIMWHVKDVPEAGMNIIGNG